MENQTKQIKKILPVVADLMQNEDFAKKIQKLTAKEILELDDSDLGIEDSQPIVPEPLQRYREGLVEGVRFMDKVISSFNY